jgi:hypothetical protein
MTWVEDERSAAGDAGGAEMTLRVAESAGKLVPLGRNSMMRRSGLTNWEEFTSMGPNRSNTILVRFGLTSATRICLTCRSPT